MRVDKFRELLAMLPADTEVFIQTVPADFAQPLRQKNISIWAASPDAIQGNIIGVNREKIVLTAFFPEKETP